MIPYTSNSARSQSPPEPPAIVRSIGKRDVLWNRPIFKAPPLRVDAPVRSVLELSLNPDLRTR
jgi:hypothetical protein